MRPQQLERKVADAPDMHGSTERIAALRQLFAERIVMLDGAMGTMIQQHRLDEAAYRGERFADWPRDLKGCNDLLVHHPARR